MLVIGELAVPARHKHMAMQRPHSYIYYNLCLSSLSLRGNYPLVGSIPLITSLGIKSVSGLFGSLALRTSDTCLVRPDFFCRRKTAGPRGVCVPSVDFELDSAAKIQF